ncbi:penicillin-binding protein activator [uncultured Roseobacter sp.]|uniref:penicillin-binding protein activator n=1 Tax=uncultured Roseobacter sp. TaxID=114847 RepID=UPI00261FC6D1|nr:penicillin-binding protein activator [uncultured Roseobacter sp.]
MFAVFPKARKMVHMILLPVVALMLAACDTLPTNAISGAPRLDTGEAVPVALLLPGGSGQSTDEILAQSLENAARLAMRDLNGAQIDLRVYQTAGNAGTAAARAQQAVEEGAKIILGPVYAASANAVGNAVAGDNIAVLSFSNTSAIAGGNVFVLGQTFQNTANRMVRYAVGQGKQRFVIVHGQDPAGNQGRQAIASAASAQGGTVVGTVGYALSQQDVIAAVPQIKAAVEGNAADAVFMTTDTASALPLLSQLLPEAGINSQTAQFMGLTRWDIPAQTLGLPGVQGGWFAVPDRGASGAFSAQYQAAYGSAPHPIAGLAFDGIAAIGALASRGSGNALNRAALTQGAGFRGASGIFRLRSDGTSERGLAVASIVNSQVVILSPAPQSFGGSGF